MIVSNIRNLCIKYYLKLFKIVADGMQCYRSLAMLLDIFLMKSYFFIQFSHCLS